MLLFARAESFNATLKILIVCNYLDECTNVIINGSNVEIVAFVAKGLEPFIVECLSEVT